MSRLLQVVVIAAFTLAPSFAAADGPRPNEAPRPKQQQAFVPPHLVLERISRMSPEERRQMLDRLPPDRRAALEERLRQFEAMAPAVRERLREEFNEFLALPAEKQQELRTLYRRFSEVPESRRTEMRRELGRLRSLPAGRRAARISDEEFRSEFNDDEREILQGMVEILPPPAPLRRPARGDKQENAN